MPDPPGHGVGQLAVPGERLPRRRHPQHGEVRPEQRRGEVARAQAARQKTAVKCKENTVRRIITEKI